MSVKEKQIVKRKVEGQGIKHEIILYNDDVNTFEFVIEALVEVCKHDLVQAEQCAMITHFNGKCTILTGSKEYLKPKCSKLNSLGLTANII